MPATFKLVELDTVRVCNDILVIMILEISLEWPYSQNDPAYIFLYITMQLSRLNWWDYSIWEDQPGDPDLHYLLIWHNRLHHLLGWASHFILLVGTH